MLDAFFVWKNWTHEVDVLHKICAELTGTQSLPQGRSLRSCWLWYRSCWWASTLDLTNQRWLWREIHKMSKIHGMIRVVLVFFNTFIITTCMCITQSHSVAALECWVPKGAGEYRGRISTSNSISISIDQLRLSSIWLCHQVFTKPFKALKFPWKQSYSVLNWPFT